jgi:hypothetical protein
MIDTEAVAEALTSYDINHHDGLVQFNIADAVMAVATAINRLAAVQEKHIAMAEQRGKLFEQMVLREARADQ